MATVCDWLCASLAVAAATPLPLPAPPEVGNVYVKKNVNIHMS